MEKVSKSSQVFVHKHLPWLLGLVVLVWYAFTLTNWVTLKNISGLVKVAGWDWRPSFMQPLHFFLTFPVRWLPDAWQIVGANFFSAVCASLSLVLLARCVALLPHDRTRDQRGLERNEYSFLSIPLAWLPPVFAVLVCGLQLSFWENAITATAEALDLLLFAYVVRCLLEYRIDQKTSWLSKAALVYGLGVTNNVAMIAFFPVFLGALVWIAGRRLLNVKLLGRLALFGLAGLTLYLVLPVYQSLNGFEALGFWEMLKFNLGNQKNYLLGFPRFYIFLVSLTSVLPVLFMGIKWPASFGDINAVGNGLTILMMHVIHAVFLLACLYVTFDPSFSPRTLVQGALAFLPMYFLGALSIGYFSGYFLLVFRGNANLKAWQRPAAWRKALNWSVIGLVCAASVFTPVALAYRNIPKIQALRSKGLSHFGELAAQSVGDRGGVVLSDDPFRLFTLHSALRAKGLEDKYLLVETSSLSQKIYHLALKKKYGSNWPDLPPTLQMAEQVDEQNLVAIIQQLAKSRDVYYLHPSFGYYLESFYLKPRNMVFQLLPLAKGQVEPPILTASEIQENLAFWKEHAEGDLKPLRRSGSDKRKKLTSENSAPEMLGAFYARSLNLVGTEMQRAGDIAKAGEIFGLAKEFSPQNAVALINYDFNRSLVAGKPTPGKYSEEATALLTAYEGNINHLLGICGPVDEPHLCALLSGVFENGQNFKQAAQQMLRFNALQPDNLPAQITLARLYIRALETELGLQQIARLRSKPELLSEENKAELIQYEAWAFTAQQEFEKAENLLKSAITQFPKSSEPLNNTLVELYIGSGRLTNAFTALESQITANPTNINPMINYTALKIRNGEFTHAIAMADRILKVDPKNTFALMNRAIACLSADRLDESEQAYNQLLNILEKPPYSIYYGLGEIAYRKKNKEEAMKNFDRYLQLIPAKSPEARLVKDRIKNLKSGTF